MLFDNYVALIKESILNQESVLIDELKKLQSKIISLHKQIKNFSYNEMPPVETSKLKEVLDTTLKQYKDFVNSNLEDIIKYPHVHAMYMGFRDVLTVMKL